MGAEKSNGASYSRRPPPRPLLQRLRYAVWDPEQRTFLGRTPHRWGVIGLIYLVMYICIIIFFSICMCGLMATMDDRIPYFTLADSIIGANPGMGHRPLVAAEGALVWYDATNDTQVRKYVDHLDEFLAPYKNKSLLPGGGANQRACGSERPPRDEVCAFSPELLGPCRGEELYGYRNKTPCIIIKLNKLFGWKPEFYDDPADLPADMPPDLKEYIANAQERRMVWVSCAGERSADAAALGSPRYHPAPGLPHVYYPYDNTPAYLPPLVAVQLEHIALGQIVNIRCRAWAKNIQYTESLKERLGSTHLEIMIDENVPKQNNDYTDGNSNVGKNTQNLTVSALKDAQHI